MTDINELRQKLHSDDLIDHVDIHANVKPVLTELINRLDAAEKERDIYKFAFNEFSEKTEWVQQGINDGTTSTKYFGWHRADVMYDLLSAAEKERDELRALVVMRFDHDCPPQFTQGYALHELIEPVTAEHCRWFVAEIERLRTDCDALRAKIEAMERQKPVGKFTQHPSNGLWEQDGYGDNPDATPLYALPGAQPQPAPSIPVEAIGKMLADVMEVAVSNGANSVSMPDEYVEVAVWLQGECPTQPAPSIPEGVSIIDTSQLEGVVSTEIVHSYPPPSGWLRAVDEALGVTHLGVANASDTYEQAKAKLDSLIGFHVDVATDPKVNGGWKLMPVEPTKEIYECFAAYDGTMYSNPFNFDNFRVDYAFALEAAPKPEAKP